MSRNPRKPRTVWLAGAAAIMPVAATLAGSAAAEMPARPQFQPPDTPLMLARTLRNPLPGGAEIRTRRSYQIRIVPEEGGYRVDGALADVTVDAPASLQALAALERARPESDMFPMHLDADGRLLPQAPRQMSAEVRQAAAAAGDRIRNLPLPREESAQAHQFVAHLEQQPGHTPWPVDLFSPAPGPRNDSRTFPLPNGMRGHVSVSIEASQLEALGLLSSFRRKITTEIGESSRVSEEIWTLSAPG